jgi:adenylate kinase
VEALARVSVDKEVVIYLKIENEDIVVGRLATRLTCSQCGAIFNTVANPPKKNGYCDFCGGSVVQRADDSKEAILRRINIYKEKTQPVIDYYQRLGKLREIDASRSIEEISTAIAEVLN